MRHKTYPNHTAEGSRASLQDIPKYSPIVRQKFKILVFDINWIIRVFMKDQKG